MSEERDFQSWLIKDVERWGGWAEGVHPGLGMKTGVPDVDMMFEGEIVPVELKVGVLTADCLASKAIRPDQIRWSKKFAKAGGASGFLCGVRAGVEWRMFLLSLHSVWEGNTHFFPHSCVEVFNVKAVWEMIRAAKGEKDYL